MKYTLLLVLACAYLGACHASIEQGPQKVGPKYFFGPDKQSMNVESETVSPTEKPAANEVETDDEVPVNMRRVILMPAFTRTLISSSGNDENQPGSTEDLPFRFFRGPPLDPLQFQRNLLRDLLFHVPSSHSDQDQLTPAASFGLNNREREDTTRDTPALNPIELLLDMMNKAIRSHGMTSSPSERPDESNVDKSLEKPDKPVTESQEEVVTINGRKYLKKSIVTRQFGDHLMFLTRRLVFTPIDEIEGVTNATTTEAPSNTDSKSATSTTPLISTTDSDNKLSTETSTRHTEETTPATSSMPKTETSSASDKVIESGLIKPAATTDAPILLSSPNTPNKKSSTDSTSSQPDDKPVPSSEPDFVRT